MTDKNPNRPPMSARDADIDWEIHGKPGPFEFVVELVATAAVVALVALVVWSFL